MTQDFIIHPDYTYLIIQLLGIKMLLKNQIQNLFLICIALLLLSSCSFKDETISDKGKNISVIKPSFWMEIDALNDDAVIQIANPLAEAYFIVIAESKTDFPDGYSLDEYSELTRGIIKNNTSNYSDSYDDSIVFINGMQAIRYNIDATVDDIVIRYWHISVASKNNFYQLIPWSLPEKIESNKENFLKVVKSFREI
ncbi:MAG: hypothetical protein PVF28_02365 [Thioalkalispiraceae bacterium]|jgi:hypothetical protein